MNPEPIVLAAVLALPALFPASLRAQEFNLDLGGSFTGLPNTYGAASGQTGTWVDVPPGTTNNLKDTSGTPSSVSINLSGRRDAFNPQTTQDSILLRDAIQNDDFDFPPTPLSASFTGLQDGDYDVYYYFHGSTSGLTINGNPLPDLAGGSADALGAEGTNWDVARVTVSGGTLDIVDTTPEDSTGLSGLQLVPAPPPTNLRITRASLEGTTFTIDFTSPEASLTDWKVMGSGDLLTFPDDLTGDSVITESTPGTYKAVVELGALQSRYFLRIER